MANVKNTIRGLNRFHDTERLHIISLDHEEPKIIYTGDFTRWFQRTEENVRERREIEKMPCRHHFVEDKEIFLFL